MVRSEAKQAARAAESSRTFRVFARSGFAANGIVHVLIGIIALVVAAGGRGESDQAGAFTAVAAAPLGFAVLWVIAIALWSLAAWHALEGLLARRPAPDAEGVVKKWGERVSEWGQAAVFAGLGVIAAAVALGARPDADEAAEETSRGVLALPGGPLLLGAVGLGFAAAGIAFFVMGVRRSFRNKVAIPSGGLGRFVEILGVVGFVAKGVALAIIGVLLLIAAIRLDPETAGGLNGAIQALLDVTGGPFLVAVVGSGLLAYGVFCGFRARYAKL